MCHIMFNNCINCQAIELLSLLTHTKPGSANWQVIILHEMVATEGRILNIGSFIKSNVVSNVHAVCPNAR